MDTWTAVVVAILGILCLIGPIWCAAAIRRAEHQPEPYNPQPEQLRQARRKLRGVTKAGSAARTQHSDDVEAARKRLETGECSICIGPLIPEPACVGGDTRHGPQLRDIAAATIEARKDSRAPESHGKQVGQDAVGDGADDGILTLRSCGHAFHARCLSSWFIIKRYDCPICRVPYYQSFLGRARRPSVTQSATAL